MRYATLVTAVLFVLGGVIPTTSQDEPDNTANKLMTQCIAVENFIDGRPTPTSTYLDGFGFASCVSYLEGFRDASMASRMAGVHICFPELGIRNDQAVRIILKYLRDNPEHLHNWAGGQTFFAFQEAFPCSESD